MDKLNYRRIEVQKTLIGREKLIFKKKRSPQSKSGVGLLILVTRMLVGAFEFSLTSAINDPNGEFNHLDEGFKSGDP